MFGFYVAIVMLFIAVYPRYYMMCFVHLSVTVAFISLLVYRTLVAHILDKTENIWLYNLSAETITVFQYYDFFSRHNITDLKSYLMHLTKEGTIFVSIS